MNLLELSKLISLKSVSNILKKDISLKTELIIKTDFIDHDAKTGERLWYIRNNITNQVKCPNCGNITKVDYQNNIIKFCSFVCNVTYRDPKTGVTKSEIISTKTKANLNSVNPKTGLTGYQESGIKSKESNLKINPETGLNGYETASLKSKESNLKINPETGLNGYETASLKGKDTMSKINPESGLTGYETASLKCKDTMSKINPKTGLTGYQESGIKAKITKLKIDPVSGLTIYQQITQNLISDSYDRKVLKFPIDYILLTTKSQYFKSQLLRYKCDKCESIRESYWPYIRCIQCYPYNKSMGENEVLEFCELLSNNVLSNSQAIIKPLELDIYLPDDKLAIEYNGLYWHSFNSVETENKDYHLIKTEKCKELGIQLFHIFENEWQDPVKHDIWKSIIKNKLGQSSRIYGRKTEIRSVSSSDKTEFLNRNHLQGTCVSSMNLGLYYGGELVSLMTFGKSRFNKNVDWELLRFCNKIGYSVIGGASKLLKAFRLKKEGSIISYADKRRSNGNLYKQLGFEFSHDSPPNYFYWKKNGLESRIKYQKHKLSKLLEVYDSGLTETENMYENGYRKIYDCGNQVWVLK